MIDRFSALATFMQAAELRNFTQAGSKLGISASAVGKAVARLEERLGVRLFNRSPRNVVLTTEGEVFLERCRKIFSELDAAELEIVKVTEVPAGRLKVSMPLTGMLLTPAISAFALAFPLVSLDLDYSDRLVDIIEEGFDVVLRTGTATDSQLMTRALGSYSYTIVGAPNYFEQAGVPVIPNDLLRHACLHHRWSTSGKLETWRLVEEGDYIDIELPITAVANTIEPLIGMAEKGVGLAYLPTFSVRRQLAAGTLVPVLDQYLNDVGNFRMVWPKGRQLLPRVRVFIDFMREHLFAELSVPKARVRD